MQQVLCYNSLKRIIYTNPKLFFNNQPKFSPNGTIMGVGTCLNIILHLRCALSTFVAPN